MKYGHWALIAGVVVVGVLLFAKRGCTSCKQKYLSMTGQQGAWPGAGPGVAVSGNGGS